ncbi:DegT/DnrJ/EryC1/StrS family aminotransferase [Acidisoma cellulosilytica]|uniref:DegT/DnrJ/EryC1/StrS family aminotransferase n=1 Tax=Acidisoma cellulosilyticum TaxID=2802395 RepID=A0A964E523_9PROT|nr:DegT/DnrJ/EryC1/StrS family aminotransferase [Acidisoma cellulosilyticum]MCB8882091.1 DegT/DnrJ/EryC1/StrS family aminotransferase [Acidisoma cellulosilyticum]
MSVAFIRPNPPRLSELGAELRAIEDSRMFSNFGPVNTRFEQDMVARMFAGSGQCMTVCNATIGLMLAMQQAIGGRPTKPRYALMPSFTFAAAAQAAMWCGLTPLFCDIDPATWAASPQDEERLLALYGDEIAVVVPYATFGFDIDLDRYERLAAQYKVPVVVDAAASLGTVSVDGRGFGSGFSGTVVFSMHATKAFSTGEAGIVYSADEERIHDLRQMCNFGFGEARSATMLGLNGKLSEIGALLCQQQLNGFEGAMARRSEIMARYRQALPDFTFQPRRIGAQAHQFGVGLLPKGYGPYRREFQAALTAAGIGNAAYFSPHLAQQRHFAEHAVFGALPVTNDVASRVISLPMFDTMTEAELDEVVTVVQDKFSILAESHLAAVHWPWGSMAAD